jgi:GWxTD domain-containing protein
MCRKRRRKEIFATLVLALLCGFLRPASAQDTSANPGHTWRDPNVSAKYRNWLREDVVYIVTDQERRDFKSLTSDKQRDDFIIVFWERRSPNPGSAENAFKEEHYRRLAYSNQHFAAGIPGWKTDRGRIYILYGPPDSRERQVTSSGPTEVWRYKYIDSVGPKVVITFTDRHGQGEYVLTDEEVDSVPRIHDGQRID